MEKWESIMIISIVALFFSGEIVHEYQRGEAKKECIRAVTAGKAEMKDCEKL